MSKALSPNSVILHTESLLSRDDTAVESYKSKLEAECDLTIGTYLEYQRLQEDPWLELSLMDAIIISATVRAIHIIHSYAALSLTL